MFDFLTVARALTDENRVRILMALRQREMCVCQITGFLDLSPSTTSKHLSILRQARLIDSKKKGKWVYYRETDLEEAPQIVRGALAWIHSTLSDNSVMKEDQKRIAEILSREETLCSPEERGEDRFHSLEIHSLADKD
jgi:Predicted transcriptional regulators